MATYNGTDVILLMGGQRIAALTANDLNPQQSPRDVTTKDSQGWKNIEYGLREVSISGQGIFFERLTNLCTYSEDFTNSAWVKTGCTVSSTRQTGRTGLKNAFLLQSVSAGDTIKQYLGDLTAFVSSNLVFSIWLAGTGTVDLIVEEVGNSSTATIALTSTLTRYELALPITDGTDCYVGLYGVTATSITMQDAMAEVNATAIATQYQPSGKVYNDLSAAVRNSTKVDVVVTNQLTATYSGQALITSLQLTAPMEETTTFSIDLTITGALQPATI